MEITAPDLKKTAKQLRQIGEREQNTAKLAPRLWNLAEDDFKKRFASSPATTASGTVFGGATWQRLSEATLRSNPKRRTGRQLIDTRELAKSFRRGGVGNIATVAGNVVEFGSSLPKAEWLDEKRPLVVMHQGLIEQAEQIFEKYLTTGR